jgi:acetyltransferase-like isoleucine patch superfamily enzyme
VTIVTGSHEKYSVPGRAAGRGYSLPVQIEDGVWISTSATILGGVRIGACSIVASSVLVHRHAPARCIVAGVPARMIRPRTRDVHE